MHGLENGDNVTPTSYTKKDEDGKKVLPTPAPRLCGQNFREAIQEPRQNLENP
ncbi:hypothetical protein [Wolbachia endosymbiont (group A) of Barypeithes pellucidus]|uniref:hypothetical protein n=1 Tax=Wolbachia endosymbiont (group A) of Barypeithes pellucidus TaxID=3139322 RepID=UPI003CCB2F61